MPEPCLVGIRGNGGLPLDCGEKDWENVAFRADWHRRAASSLSPRRRLAPSAHADGGAPWGSQGGGGSRAPTGHFRRRVRAVAFSTQWEPPTSIQRRSARKLGFLGPRLCDGFRVCVSAELRAFPASLLSTSPPSSLRIPGSGQAEGGSSSCIGGTQHPRHRAWPPHKPQSCNSCNERTVDSSRHLERKVRCQTRRIEMSTRCI